MLSGVEHFFTTRELCLFSKEADMTDNRRVVEEFLGQKMATNQPVHGINIEKVVSGKFFYADTDGLLLRKGYAAYMNFGDCVPVILYCGDGGIIAHAGWRGTVNYILGHTLDKMRARYGTEGKEVIACIGPGISLSAFEVGDEVYEAFRKNGFQMDYISEWKPATHKYHIDLWAANRLQLLDFGVPSAQVETANICTFTQYEEFFSARRMGIKSGRILSGIMLTHSNGLH